MTKDKKSHYELLCRQVTSLSEGETNRIGLLANVTALLRMTFGERFFWVGFYLVEGNELVLGPFQGDIACMHIGHGQGVCGTAWEQDETLVVPDVEQFPGHIACSTLSRSEIVVPLHDTHGKVTGVLDIDSKEIDAFDEDDRQGLENLVVCLTSLFRGWK